MRTRGPLSQAHRDARTRGPLIQAHLDARARGPLNQAHLDARTRGPLIQAHLDARARGPLHQAHLDARARGPLIQADLDARTRGPLIQAHLDVRTRGPLPGLSLCPRMLFFQACPTRAPGSSTITCKILSPVKLTVPSSLSPSPCVHHQPPGRLVGCVRLPALSGLQTLGEQNCLFLMP